jgi:hypothetical protein
VPFKACCNSRVVRQTTTGGGLRQSLDLGAGTYRNVKKIWRRAGPARTDLPIALLMPTAARPAFPQSENCSTEGYSHESIPSSRASENAPSLGILDSLEIRNRQAVEQKLAYTIPGRS